MKKLWFLIAMLLLVGCGNSSSTSTTVSTGTGSGSGGIIEVGPDTPAGKVVVNITGIEAQTADEKTAEAQPTPTGLRLVITNPSLRIGGSPYKVIVDGAYVSSLTLSFPVANNYTFQVVTYIPGGTPSVNRMLKYAKAFPVNITTSGAIVNLVTTPIVASFTLPNPTISGQTLNITANMPQPTPLLTAWNLFLSTSPITTALHTTTALNHTAVHTPIVLSAGTLYAQGEFFISTTLLDTTPTGTVPMLDTAGNPVTHTTETFRDWTFNYPNPEAGFDTFDVSAPLNLVSATINIS